METLYYVIADGQQTGPFPKEHLKYQGVTVDTFVWRQGLEGWVKAGQLPELSDIFAEESAFGGYAEVPPRPAGHEPYGQRGQAPYGQPYENPAPPYGEPSQYPGPGYPVAHTNWLPWAIVATVVGVLVSCLGAVFGIIGIVQANKANGYYAVGNTAQGNASNSTARTMTIIGLVLCGVGLIGIGTFISSGGFTALTNTWSAIL